jgi:hypothetical protein
MMFSAPHPYSPYLLPGSLPSPAAAALAPALTIYIRQHTCMSSCPDPYSPVPAQQAVPDLYLLSRQCPTPCEPHRAALPGQLLLQLLHQNFNIQQHTCTRLAPLVYSPILAARHLAEPCQSSCCNTCD